MCEFSAAGIMAATAVLIGYDEIDLREVSK
jgi:hypothetical protein